MHVSLKYPHQREHRGSCLFKKQMTNDDILTRWIARRLKTSFGFIWTVGQVGILEYLECFVQYVFRLPVRKEENHVHLHHSTWILYIESVPIQPRTLTTLVRNLNQFSRIQYRGTAPPQKKNKNGAGRSSEFGMKKANGQWPLFLQTNKGKAFPQALLCHWHISLDNVEG